MEQFKDNQWKIGGKDGDGNPIAYLVADTASKISQYSSVLEPLTQATPFVPPVVWGAFSLLMKVCIPTLSLHQFTFLLMAQSDAYFGLKDGYG